MVRFVFWSIVGAALAAPQFSSSEEVAEDVSKRDVEAQAVLPPGFTPPPLNLPLGGVRTYAPVQTKNKITKHSSKTQIYTHTYTAAAVKPKPKIGLRGLPEDFSRPALDLPNGGVVTYRTLPASASAVTTALQERDAPPPGFTPPPLTLHDGGRHTLQPANGRYVAQHVSFHADEFTNTAHKKLPTVTHYHSTHSPSSSHAASKTHSKAPHHRREPIPMQLEDLVEQSEELVERDMGPAKAKDDPSSGSTDVITTVYPSPGASGIPITEQGEVITSYVPVTSCPNSASTSCQTSYSPTVTPICNTELLPLGAPPIAVTDCYQYVTYSSEYGYSFIPLTTAAPAASGATPAANSACVSTSLQTRTTFYAAFWTDLNPGLLPTDWVKGVVCRDNYCGTAAVTFVMPTPPLPSPTGSDDEAPLPTNPTMLTQTDQGRVQSAQSSGTETGVWTLGFGQGNQPSVTHRPEPSFTFKSAPQPNRTNHLVSTRR